VSHDFPRVSRELSACPRSTPANAPRPSTYGV